VWTRTVNGKPLHFYLAGINNQNFLMRDKETGTWWQQITGKAIYGPLKGASLGLVLSDELTYGEWKSEFSDGKVLAPVPKYVKEYDPKWEADIAKLPVVISFAGTELKSRDVVVGLEMPGPGRAYPWDTLVKQSPVVDRVNGTPLLIAVGPDGKSFRIFISRIDGKDAEFFLKGETEGESANGITSEAKSESKGESEAGTKPESKTQTKTKTDSKAATPAATKPETPSATKPAASADAKAADAKAAGTPSDTKPADAKPTNAKADASTATKPAPPAPQKPGILRDTATASEWNFQGCAISGPSQGKCLDRVPALKDYWFDWRNYHPDTTVYKH